MLLLKKSVNVAYKQTQGVFDLEIIIIIHVLYTRKQQCFKDKNNRSEILWVYRI